MSKNFLRFYYIVLFKNYLANLNEHYVFKILRMIFSFLLSHHKALIIFILIVYWLLIFILKFHSLHIFY